MGESKTQRLSVWSRALVASLTLLVVHIGCSSANRQDASVGTTGTSPVAATASAQTRTPAQIESLDLTTDTAAGAVIEVRADRPLVWTSFRNPDGDLVVELPNTVPTATIASSSTASGLLAEVSVEKLEDSERPLTRLVVRTREPSEHALSGTGGTLQLELMPIASAQDVTLAYEPVAEDPVPQETAMVAELPVEELAIEPVDRSQTLAEEVQAAPPAASETYIPQTYGTPEAPQIGPPPEGVVASQLYDVQVLESSGSTLVLVSGDGEFSYSTFRLQNPERFVIDLNGVVSTGASSTVPVGNSEVDQIRVGQFKPRPEPVSRVVFDLSRYEVPMVTSTADGLMVAFGEAVERETVAVVPTPAVEPEPEAVVVVAEQAPSTSDTWTQPEDTASLAGESLAVEETTVSEVPVAEITDETLVEDRWATSTATEESAPQAPTAAAPPVPVYEPAPAMGDVALFEAQNLEVAEDGRTQQERLLESFGPLVVSRQEREYVGEPINMSLKNADLVETLRSFAKISDLNFVIQPGVKGTVTVELKGVPWDQAMEQILKINNLGMDIDGTIVRIAPSNQLRDEAEEERKLRLARQQSIPLRTVMRSLSYAQVGAMSSLLRNRSGAILSRRGTVQVDTRTNTLIIRELPDNIDTVLSVIDQLDTPEPQVTIEAKIVEATKSFSRTLGIRWDYDFESSAQNGNTTGLQFPNSVDSDGGVGLLTGGANGFLNLSLGNILDTFRLNASIQAAENEGLVNVISAPRVTTLNNNSANIQSGLQIPIQTVSDRTVSVQFVNATLSLNVTPQVTAEGTVLLDINVAKRTPQLGLAVVGATNAPISTKEARTRVIVRDGGTAVIGGIYEVSTNLSQDRVPGLSRVPILGYLFKNRNRSVNNDELMIFITPRIVQI